MQDIICPNCKKVFKVDEVGFADILKQVRDHQFEEELRERLDIAEKEKEKMGTVYKSVSGILWVLIIFLNFLYLYCVNQLS